MINAKSVSALSLLIISGIELLAIKDQYRLGVNTFLITLVGMFFITIITAAFLLVKGLREK